MASSFTPDGSAGGAFVCEAGTYAIGRSEITTTTPGDPVSIRFHIARRALHVRVGTAAGGQDVVNDTRLEPGVHVLTFTPGSSPYWFEAQLRDAGHAQLYGFAHMAAGALDLPTPWAESQLVNLRSEQSLDVQWWCHGSHQTRALERRGPLSWSLREFQPKDGPFEADEDSGVVLTPNARTGTANINANAPVFSALDLGSLIRLSQPGQYETMNADAVSEATDPIRVNGTGAARSFIYEVSGTFSATWVLQRSIGSDVAWTDVTSGTGAATSSLNDTLDGQIVYYRLILTAYASGTAVLALTYSGGVTDGVGRIHSVDADNAVTVDVLEPFAALTGTSEWARGSWSNRYGWPTALALHDGRLHFVRGSRRWASTPDGFEAYEIGAEDDDAIAGHIPGQMNAARWMKSGDRLMLATAGGVGWIGSGGEDNLLTPANARARIKANTGAAASDAVAISSGEVVYIDRSRQKIIMAAENGEKIAPVDVTRYHRRAAGGANSGFLELAWQANPEPRLWAVRVDGQVMMQTLDVIEEVGAISRMVPAAPGHVESVCVLPGTPEDHVYFVIRRGFVRYIEKLAVERWEDSRDAVRLQSAIVYSGAPTTTITGLDHLPELDVWVWGDGYVQGPFTVPESGGTITLPYAISRGVIGLKYEGSYLGPRLFNALTRQRRIETLGMIIHQTPAGLIGWGKSLSDISDYLRDRQTDGSSYDSALPLLSQDQEYSFPPSHSHDPRLAIKFTGVGPATLLGLVITTNGG